MSSQSFPVSFNGGIDVVTPAIEKKPGELLTGINIEPYIDGGYIRAKGYEVFDGGEALSNLTLSSNGYSAGSGVEPVIGDTFNSSNTIAGITVESGSWGTGDAVGVIYVQDDYVGVETGSITFSNSATCTLSDDLIVYNEYGFLPTSALQFYADVYEARRDLVQIVPGSGVVLGVHIYLDDVYAFRNSTDGTEAFMYKSTINGWQLITTPTLLPGGKYDFINYTMSNDTATGGEKMYGCNGVDYAFQYHPVDGFIQIITNVPDIPDYYPSFVVGQRDHLMVGFSIGQISISTIGDPLDFDETTGASRFIISDEITGFNHVVGDDLVIYCRNSIRIMYGRTNDPLNDPFKVEAHSINSGAFRWTGQSSQFSLFMSGQGISSLNAVLEYGNFEILALSLKVRPLLSQYEDDNLIAGSVYDNDHGVYRLYMRDGKQFVMSYDGKTAGSIILNDYKNRIHCVCQGKFFYDRVFFAGGEDGYVYQLEKGNSLNGDVIPMSLQTVYDHFLGDNPPMNVDTYKTFNKIRVLIDSPDELIIQLNIDTSFGNSPPNLTSQKDGAISSGGGVWDVSKWNEFVWSGSQVAEDERYIDAIGHNLSTYMYSETKFTRPYVIQGIVYQFMVRGQLR